MIIAVTFFFSKQSPRGTVICIISYEIKVVLGKFQEIEKCCHFKQYELNSIRSKIVFCIDFADLKKYNFNQAFIISTKHLFILGPQMQRLKRMKSQKKIQSIFHLNVDPVQDMMVTVMGAMGIATEDMDTVMVRFYRNLLIFNHVY